MSKEEGLRSQAPRHIMASRLKLKKGKRRAPPDPGRPDTFDYNEAAKNSAWANERKWADKIMESNKRMGIVQGFYSIMRYFVLNLFSIFYDSIRSDCKP